MIMIMTIFTFTITIIIIIIIVIMQKSLNESINSKTEEFALQLDENCQVKPFDHIYDDAEFWGNATSEMLRKEMEILTLRLKNLRNKQKKISVEFGNETTPLML